MKLYTEEQVRKIYSIAHKTGDSGYAESFDLDVKELSITPIELPSDEEIDKKAYNWCQVEHDEDGYIRAGDDYDISEMPAFIAGAKWMKEQILTQNK